MIKKTIYIAGHKGMVGSAIKKYIENNTNHKILTENKKKLNLLDRKKISNFLNKHKPDLIIIAAAKVGGINANNCYPAEFIYNNLMIECNLIHEAHLADIKKLIFLGSSCIYPKKCPQPIKEEYLLTGQLEPTNEPYAIAKIAGIKICESYNRQYSRDYRSIMPTNLYGPNDNFDKNNSHVIPALIRKFHDAKINNKKRVEVWGSGHALRDFLYVDDLAEASYHLLNVSKKQYNKSTSLMCSHINASSGKEINIRDLSKLIKKITNYSGKIVFNKKMPDGTYRKYLDNSKIIDLGWNPKMELIEGLKLTYNWFKLNKSKFY